jgi:hypothetical protein
MLVYKLQDSEAHLQLYIPCSPTGFRATLASEVVHQLSESGHMYGVE